MKTIIVGAGSDLGVHIDGAHLGPTQLLNDIQSFYKGDTISFIQDQNIIKSRNLSDRRKNEYEIERFNTALYKVLTEKMTQEYFPILIGGDHSIAISSALAAAKTHTDIGVIWFDAHADFNTFSTTQTGNIHGLPLAAIAGYENEDLRYFHDGNTVHPSKIVIVGARSIDEGEKDNLRYAGIKVFTTNDIKERGVEAIVEEAFAIAGKRTKGIHISYDLDLIDPSFAPGVSVPEFDGITADEAMKINEMIIKNIDKVISYDLVEFNPLRDVDRKTEQIAVNLLAQIINAANKKDKYGKINLYTPQADKNTIENIK